MAKKPTLVGYAAKFDRLASIGGYFDERIAQLPLLMLSGPTSELWSITIPAA